MSVAKELELLDRYGSPTIKLLVGPGKVNNYFRGGYFYPAKKKQTLKNVPSPFFLYHCFIIKGHLLHLYHLLKKYILNHKYILF